MNGNLEVFLNKFADLMKEHNVGLYYDETFSEMRIFEEHSNKEVVINNQPVIHPETLEEYLKVRK